MKSNNPRPPPSIGNYHFSLVGKSRPRLEGGWGPGEGVSPL